MTNVWMFFSRPKVYSCVIIAVGFIASAALVTAGLAISRVSQQADNLAEFSRATVQANIAARYDDCQSLEEVKAAERIELSEGREARDLLFELLPQLDTPRIHQLIERAHDRRVEAYEQDDCEAYALEALPAGANPSDYKLPAVD